MNPFLPFHRERLPINDKWHKLLESLKLATGKNHNPLVKSEVRNFIRGYDLYLWRKAFKLKKPISKPERLQGILVGKRKKKKNEHYLLLKYRPNIINFLIIIIYWCLLSALIFYIVNEYRSFQTINQYLLILGGLILLSYIGYVRALNRRIKKLRACIHDIIYRLDYDPKHQKSIHQIDSKRQLKALRLRRTRNT